MEARKQRALDNSASGKGVGLHASGKKKGAAEDDGELNPDGLAAKMLYAENFSLKRQLAERREDALLAISQRKQLQAQIED